MVSQMTATPPASAPATRWSRRKDVRPGEILEAALKLFVEKGFRATKMEDIAREAGVTKGTPYLYYENKEEIFKAVIREGMLTKFDELEGLSGQDEASAETRLRQVIYRWWESIGNTRLAGLSKLMIAEAANFPELASFYHAEVIVRCRNMVRHVLEEGVERGEFHILNMDHAVEIVIAPLLLAMVWKHSFHNFESAKFDMPAHLDNVLDVLLNGLKTR